MKDELTPFLNGQVNHNTTSMGFEQSTEIGKLATALAKAQKEITGAEKNATNPHFRSGYADLHSVIESCREILSKNGIAFLQGFWHNMVDGNCHVYVSTQLTHSSGEWIRSMVYLPTERSNPQGVGSAVTYGRRYGLSAMVGISQYDDDGNEASMPYTKTQGDLARFDELKKHKAFAKTKKKLNDEWLKCNSMSKVHTHLMMMQTRIDQFEATLTIPTIAVPTSNQVVTDAGKVKDKETVK